MKIIIYILFLITVIGCGSSSKKEETPQISHNVELTTQNKSYFTNDKIIINFKNMSENDILPSNKIISIDTFFATGGFLDNIKLSN